MNNILVANPDSLRDIIAGGDPQGVARTECKKDNAKYLAGAWNDMMWQDAITWAQNTPEAGQTPLPDTIPPDGGAVQVNDSASLRCLLQEIVGFQKMAMFVQIQSLLKQYISDAQQQQLSNQLLNQINATNLNWAKQGEQVTAGGVQMTEPVYVLNSTQTMYNENVRIADTIIAQTAATQNDPIGTLEIEPDWQLDVASQLGMNLRYDTENPRDSFVNATRSTLTAPSGPFAGAANGAVAFDNYLMNANTPEGLGAIDTLASMLNNPQNTPIGLVALVTGEADRRIEEEDFRRDKGEANSGFRPTKTCSGAPGDPYCDPAFMTDVSPADASRVTIAEGALQSGNAQIADSNDLDSTSANAAETLSTTANAGVGGVFGYDATPLLTSGNSVHKLIYELYGTINYAYFDLDWDQTYWAQAALLSIYDAMIFNDQTPQVGAPTTPTNPDDNSYMDQFYVF
ncbi:MAG: hypothetical protein A2942_00790 [Candidatus Lloydbacteria bacterium RIFCSPLOWO2_01_FULL_50_20]|uniref:Uncharacterized protein n=1 Tax=Candidatus Lloydbacteria bacterium RIFCSPLOWO2_01_FULL_50_20 TaxID=1798665 RepID=A0A1G2DD20_9BACT|nr:MAG: hypothetical protein A2942_00790 [Candidatus Lloydbacteria bacterium RIFCSPLOWO2_01_FULL_50_20]